MSIKIDKLKLSKPAINIFQQTQNIILDDLSIEFQLNGFHLIIGESGAGKTTFLRCLYTLEKYDSGNITINNIDIINFQDKIKFLFQFNGELLNPFRLVSSMLKDSLMKNDISNYQIESIVNKYLDEFNLDRNILFKKGYQLSGGEHQRIALIRLLLTEPNILLLDEPFSSQDFQADQIIAENLIRLNKENKMTIICVSHNLVNIINHVDTIAVLHQGKILEFGNRELVLSNPKEELTKNLLGKYLAEP